MCEKNIIDIDIRLLMDIFVKSLSSFYNTHKVFINNLVLNKNLFKNKGFPRSKQVLLLIIG